MLNKIQKDYSVTEIIKRTGLLWQIWKSVNLCIRVRLKVNYPTNERLLYLLSRQIHFDTHLNDRKRMQKSPRIWESEVERISGA